MTDEICEKILKSTNAEIFIQKQMYEPVHPSMFYYDRTLTTLSFKPKRSKMVYLLSLCDEEGTVNETTKSNFTMPQKEEYTHVTKCVHTCHATVRPNDGPCVYFIICSI